MKSLVICSLLVVVTLHQAESRSPRLRVCAGKAADVVFVLDASSSINVHNFHRYVRPFVRQVVGMFDIGPDSHQTRVGVVTYNHDYNPLIDLGSYLSRHSLDRALDKIVYTGGSTFSSKALEFVADDMFTAENGARAAAVPVIILMTDGKSRFPNATRQEAEQARAKGVHIFTIGVGEDVVEPELRAIASDPDSSFMFHVRDYTSLHSIQQLLAIRTCEVQPVPTTEKPQGDLGPEAIEYCGGKPADVYFLLDVSSSVWVENFNTKVLPFVRDIVNVFDIGPRKTRVGLVTFSHEITPVISLDQYTSRDDLLQALHHTNVRYTGGRTFTSSAIKYVREHGFAARVARPGVAQIVILVTDGISFKPTLTAVEAEKTKRQGIYMFSIGVGKDVDYKELTAVSSDPDDRFTFTVTDFDALSSIRNILAIRTCKVLPLTLPKDQFSVCDMDPTDLYFVYEGFSKSTTIRKVFRAGVVQLVKSTFINDTDVKMAAITDPCFEGSIEFTTLLDFKLQFGSMSVAPRTPLYNLIGTLRSRSLVTRYGRRKQVGVIFLDENTKDFNRIIMEARKAQSANIELFVVAIGSVESRILDVIGSRPSRDHVIVLDSYADMPLLADRLGRKLC